MSETHFTASTIARCLECKPQLVRKQIKNFAPDGTRVVNGNITAAWSLASLPSPITERLAKLASRFGYSTPVELLQNPPALPAPISLAGVAEDHLDEAGKRMRALAPVLRGGSDNSCAELARRAARAYACEFGHKVSDRYLRGLIRRIQLRDGGQRKFDRLQLYIREKPARTHTRTRIDAAFAFDELDAALSTIRDRNRPTISEIAYCWRETVRMVDARIGAGANEIKQKQQLRRYIMRNASFLGATDIAVKRTLNRKLRDAIDGGGIDQLSDGRLNPSRSGKVSALDLAGDVQLLIGYAAEYCYGRLSQAYRELHTGNSAKGQRFSEPFRVRFTFDPRRAKSAVPKDVRLLASAAVERRLASIRGSRAKEALRASAQLDWNNVASGDWFSADDATANHYVYEFRPDGDWECEEGRFNVGRPQWLPGHRRAYNARVGNINPPFPVVRPDDDHFDSDSAM